MCLTHLKYFISWQNSDWSHTAAFIQHIQAVSLSFTLSRPSHPASLPSHVFLQLQHSLFMQSSNPATSSSPVPWSARALFCDPYLISVLSPLVFSLANKTFFFFTYHLTNNHFHPPAQFLSLLKFNPQCWIQIDMLTDCNRMLTRKHDRQIPRSQFLWLYWFDLSNSEQQFQGKSRLKGGKHPLHT